MRRATAVLLVAAVFAAGVLVGALGTRLVQHRRGFLASRLERRAAFAQRMGDRLSLTAEQRERIGAILRETRTDARSLHRRMQPEAIALIERTAARIRSVLTPEQQRKFDELRGTERRRADRFLLGRGSPPPWLRRMRQERMRGGEREPPEEPEPDDEPADGIDLPSAVDSPAPGGTAGPGALASPLATSSVPPR